MNNYEFGTPAHLLTRTADPETSHAAGESVDTTKMESEIFNHICQFLPEFGCTSYQIYQASGVHPWSISPRIKGLERKGYIYYQGDTRKGGSGRQMRIMRVNRRRVHRVIVAGRRGDDPQWATGQQDLL